MRLRGVNRPIPWVAATARWVPDYSEELTRTDDLCNSILQLKTAYDYMPRSTEDKFLLLSRKLTTSASLYVTFEISLTMVESKSKGDDQGNGAFLLTFVCDHADDDFTSLRGYEEFQMDYEPIVVGA